MPTEFFLITQGRHFKPFCELMEKADKLKNGITIGSKHVHRYEWASSKGVHDGDVFKLGLETGWGMGKRLPHVV